MDNILFIDATVRSGSRTRELAEYLLQTLGETVETLVLDDEKLSPLTAGRLTWREECCRRGDFSDAYFDCARQFAAADTIVIAAPFWDGSFPAVLKKYVETVCVRGITFRYTEAGEPQGLCRTKKLYYVTTSGGPIFSDAYGFGYIDSLARTMFGIPETVCIKAEGLDLFGADVPDIMKRAKKEIEALAEDAQ